MLNQVNIDKDPTFSDLGAGDFSESRFLGQGNRMYLEEGGSFLQGERFHEMPLSADWRPVRPVLVAGEMQIHMMLFRYDLQCLPIDAKLGKRCNDGAQACRHVWRWQHPHHAIDLAGFNQP